MAVRKMIPRFILIGGEVRLVRMAIFKNQQVYERQSNFTPADEAPALRAMALGQSQLIGFVGGNFRRRAGVPARRRNFAVGI